MLQGMERTVTRNLLKYAAGHAIFCPMCDAILDWKRTVIIGAGTVTKVCCTECWDSSLKPILVQRGSIDRCEITDGREVK